MSQEKKLRVEKTFDPTASGIGGIKRTLEENMKGEAELASQAFTSLRSLVDNAKEVVRVDDA